ncbi:hypothetical protein RRG08_015242 [Elysia crispata]|uniref:Uncharacterized protein n=1 Tax=Elysia crispata TaxID=231223 RepID=A0AAE0YZX5_9GAST|nr:hypothetical protein RRG08_015242 [Elysia crispata]
MDRVTIGFLAERHAELEAYFRAKYPNSFREKHGKHFSCKAPERSGRFAPPVVPRANRGFRPLRTRKERISSFSPRREQQRRPPPTSGNPPRRQKRKGFLKERGRSKGAKPPLHKRWNGSRHLPEDGHGTEEKEDTKEASPRLPMWLCSGATFNREGLRQSKGCIRKLRANRALEIQGGFVPLIRKGAREARTWPSPRTGGGNLALIFIRGGGLVCPPHLPKTFAEAKV